MQRAWSWQSFPSAEALFGEEASQGECEHGGRMPKGMGPGFHYGRMAVGKIAGKGFEPIRGNNFTAGFLSDGFKQGHVGSKRTEFFGGEVGGPTGGCMANFGTCRVGYTDSR